MKNQPAKQQLSTIPKFYKTEGISPKEKIIHFHFEFRNCHWFMAEFNGEDSFFGFAILNGDLEMAEWGYISYELLRMVDIDGEEVVNDLEWEVRKAMEVELICDAQRWG